MAKVKLYEISEEAKNNKIEIDKKNAADFAKDTALPYLVEAARRGKGSERIYVPAGIHVGFVLSALNELVEAELKRDGRYICASWWNPSESNA